MNCKCGRNVLLHGHRCVMCGHPPRTLDEWGKIEYAQLRWRTLAGKKSGLVYA